MYTVEGFHLKGICGYTGGNRFKSVCDAYIEELFKNSKTNYANMMRESEAHFLKFLRGDVRLVDITPELIEQYAAYLEKRIGAGRHWG
jgi:hypothetical protein